MTPTQARADRAAEWARYRASWKSPPPETLDPYPDDRDPEEDAMYFRAAPYGGKPV